MTTPTGVFVRLPLTAEHLNKFQHYRNGGCKPDVVMRAIGTPVTGGKLKPFLPNTAGPLVKLSDAQTAIAALEAEVGRLREVIEEIELGIDALSSEEDDGGRMTASEMKRQALEVVRSEIKALKGPEA